MKTYLHDIGVLPQSRSLYQTYITGFVFSILCTLAAYALVASHALSRTVLLICIVAFALIQCAIQAFCFLHLSMEKGSRLKLLILCSALVVVGILVSGSLWIMLTLNGRMMPSDTEMQHYMQGQGGF